MKKGREGEKNQIGGIRNLYGKVLANYKWLKNMKGLKITVTRHQRPQEWVSVKGVEKGGTIGKKVLALGKSWHGRFWKEVDG